MIPQALSVRGHSRKLLHAISALLLLLNIAAAPLTSAQPVFSPAAKPAPPKPSSAAVQTNMAALPLAFEPNRGQADPQFTFLAHSANGAIGFMPTGLLISQNIAAQPTTDPLTRGAIPISTTALTLGLSWQGSNPQTVLRATAQLPGVINYLRGNDPAHWQRDVPTYRALTYENLYPGIDLHYDGDGHGLKGTYTVAPGADPALIRWRYDAAATPTLDPAGNLQLQARTDPSQRLTASQQQAALVTEQAPVAWQERATGRDAVSARFTLAADGSVGFMLGAYDHSRLLVLDPYLLYSTPLGWGAYGYGIAVDASGAIYVTGITIAPIFPLVNPIQSQNNGEWDAYVSKISPDGAALVYSTFLGGSLTEVSNGIAVDAAGHAYITGWTGTPGYPVTPGAYDTQGDSLDKAFISVLNERGDGFVYSTFLGLPQAVTHGWGIAVTPDGWATVTGSVDCRCFPERRALFPDAFGQGFVARFTPDGQLDYGTRIPGTFSGLAVALDARGNVYVGGYTQDPFLAELPTLHAIQVNWHSLEDSEGFVIALVADGSSELYGTLLGGGGNDQVIAIAVNAVGEATVSGWTRSGDLFPPVGPLLQTAPLQSHSGGGADGFVARFSEDGSSLRFATYLGGSADDHALGVAVNSTGATYITGQAFSLDFPTSHAVQWTNAGPGNRDTFLSKLNPTGTAFEFSTYLGGSGDEQAWALAAGADGNAYFTGNAISEDFPTARPLHNAGSMDGGSFIAIIGDNCAYQFSDVPDGSTFYPYVRALVCRGVASGYADGTYHIGAGLTRGQMAKIVATAANLHAYVPDWQQTFADVPPDNPFWAGIEQLAKAGIAAGYSCGQAPDEPCGANDDHRPYFRPFASVTRGQTAKLVAQTIGWREAVPAQQQSFADVLPSDAFWADIERLKAHGAIAGYTCGQAANELCDDADRPYYRPGSSVTRGQAAKIAANSFYPNDAVPSPTPTIAPTYAGTKDGARP